MDLEKLINEIGDSNITKPLTRVAGRNYVYKQPASVRVTRKDRQNILKETDPAQVKAAMEIAFKQIIAAASGTSVQQIAISKINALRKQVFDRLDREQ